MADTLAHHKRVQRDLRDLYFVHFHLLPEEARSAGLAEKQIALDRKLAGASDKPYYDYYRGRIERYFELLPREAELWRELEVTRKAIYAVNRPATLTYVLEKID